MGSNSLVLALGMGKMCLSLKGGTNPLLQQLPDMGFDGGGFGDGGEAPDRPAVGVEEEFCEVPFDPAAE